MLRIAVCRFAGIRGRLHSAEKPRRVGCGLIRLPDHARTSQMRERHTEALHRRRLCRWTGSRFGRPGVDRHQPLPRSPPGPLNPLATEPSWICCRHYSPPRRHDDNNGRVCRDFVPHPERAGGGSYRTDERIQLHASLEPRQRSGARTRRRCGCTQVGSVTLAWCPDLCPRVCP